MNDDTIEALREQDRQILAALPLRGEGTTAERVRAELTRLKSMNSTTRERADAAIEDRAAMRALVDALPVCVMLNCCLDATCKVGIGVYCDDHGEVVWQQAEPGYEDSRRPIDLHYAAPLRALLAQMATWPAASPCTECGVVAAPSDILGIHPVTREYVCRGCAETIDPRREAGTIAVATPEQLAVRWPSWVKVGLKVRGRGNTSTEGVPITLVEDNQLRIGTDVYHLAWTGRFEKLWEVVPDSHAPLTPAAARAEADRLKAISEAARDDYMAAECHARALETRETEARWKAHGLLAPFTGIEQLDYYDCVILGAGLNAAGERVLFVATCDGEGDTAVRHLHAVIDEPTYVAYRRGETTLKVILEASPFYLVTTPFDGGEKTIVEMTLADLDAKDVPGVDSFCPDFSRLPRLEAT